MKDYLTSYDEFDDEHKTKIFCFMSKDDAIKFWSSISFLYPDSCMLVNPIMVTYDNDADGKYLDEEFHKIYDKRNEK